MEPQASFAFTDSSVAGAVTIQSPVRPLKRREKVRRAITNVGRRIPRALVGPFFSLCFTLLMSVIVVPTFVAYYNEGRTEENRALVTCAVAGSSSVGGCPQVRMHSIHRAVHNFTKRLLPGLGRRGIHT